MDPKDLLAAFEKRDEKLIAELAAVQTKTAAVADQLLEVEQKLARTSNHGGGDYSSDSIGKQFVNSDNVKGFLASGASSGKVDMRFKATITSATTNAAGSAGSLTGPFRDPNLVSLPQQPLAVRDLLPSIQITQPSVEVMVQSARNLNAAPVAEGALKSESDLQFELQTFNAKTIAHWMKASRQILDDAPQLRGTIDTELMYGLKLQEDQQLLNGDGTGQNLHGLVPQATAFSEPITLTAPTMIDIIGLALLQNALALYPADGVVMNPADWMRIRLMKDTDGNYIYGPPSEAVVPRIFGVPVVATPAMTIDKFLVGQFQVAGTVYDRWDARIEVGYANDDFIRNLVTVLGEERLAFAVKKPLALTYGDFGNVA